MAAALPDKPRIAASTSTRLAQRIRSRSRNAPCAQLWSAAAAVSSPSGSMQSPLVAAVARLPALLPPPLLLWLLSLLSASGKRVGVSPHEPCGCGDPDGPAACSTNAPGLLRAMDSMPKEKRSPLWPPPDEAQEPGAGLLPGVPSDCRERALPLVAGWPPLRPTAPPAQSPRPLRAPPTGDVALLQPAAPAAATAAALWRAARGGNAEPCDDGGAAGTDASCCLDSVGLGRSAPPRTVPPGVWTMLL
eukprot:365592-Chlamydomonas_euryale.AAC.14